jgi:hypothetical protein
MPGVPATIEEAPPPQTRSSAVRDDQVVQPPGGSERPTSGEPEAAAAIKAEQSGAPTNPPPVGESPAEFEDAQAILAQMDEAAAKAGETTDLRRLDSELASAAQRAIESDDEPAPVAAAALAGVAGAAPAAEPSRVSVPAGQAGGAPVSPASEPAAAGERFRTIVHGAGGAGRIARGIRRAATAPGRLALRAMAPVAARFEKLPVTVRRIVSLGALGTMLQAALLWAWIIYARPLQSADAAILLPLHGEAGYPYAPHGDNSPGGASGHESGSGTTGGHDGGGDSHAASGKSGHAGTADTSHSAAGTAPVRDSPRRGFKRPKPVKPTRRTASTPPPPAAAGH